jgi:hypothetical protein
MPLKTTMSTLDAHYMNLLVESIPKSFLDAMIITRELGFRYLWIDSICIVLHSYHD